MKKNKINVGDVVIFSEGTIDVNHLFEGVVVKKIWEFISMTYYVLYYKDGREQINKFDAMELHLKNRIDDLKLSLAKPNQINAHSDLLLTEESYHDKNDKIKLLINSILKWWKDHEFDTYRDNEEEYNIYGDDPEFVRLAKQLTEKGDQL